MKKIAIINDLSGHGKCSLTAALPVVSALGVQACPLPTAILSAQTAYDDYLCIDFTTHMNEIQKKWYKTSESFDGIYTGFVSSDLQLDVIFDFVKNFKTSDNFLLVDPIMGDDGVAYDMFTEPLLKKMIQLSKLADIITPNITELCLLSGYDYHKLEQIADKDSKLNTIGEICLQTLEQNNKVESNSNDKAPMNNPYVKNKMIIVTGVKFMENGKEYMANVCVTTGELRYIAHPYLGGSYSGTGDLFASCMVGGLAQGLDVYDIMQIASDFLFQSIEDSVAHNVPYQEGVMFENYLHTLYPLVKNHKTN